MPCTHGAVFDDKRAAAARWIVAAVARDIIGRSLAAMSMAPRTKRGATTVPTGAGL